MPRKQNGFGKSKAFNGISRRTDRGKKSGAIGLYPSYRGYGSSVQRSLLEKWDLDSDWARWRRGMEYFYHGAFEQIYATDLHGKQVVDADGYPIPQTLESVLYQGTPYEMDLEFVGWRFATKNSDTRNHYVVKRQNIDPPNLGVITAVENDSGLYPDQKLSGEIWTNVTGASNGLRKMLYERITDGESEATLTHVLTQDKHPAVYVGKSYTGAAGRNQTTVKVTVPLAEVLATDYLQQHNGDVQCLVGEIGYVKNFYVEQAISNETFEDYDQYFVVEANEQATTQDFEILDSTGLPPSLYDIANLPKLYSTANADYQLNGRYLYSKDLYQRFFGRAYLTGELVESEVSELSFTVMPFMINSVLIVGNNLEITSIPFDGELTLYSNISNGYLVFSDTSFTNKQVDSYAGNYYHSLGAPGSAQWQRLDTDVDPWMDEVFTSGNQLKPADAFCCSCADYSKSTIRMPETTKEDGQLANRQQRYPLPSVMGKSDFDALGINVAAGIVNSWESNADKVKFKMCKHTIAAMFSEKIKVKEPNKYPSVDTRMKFDEKLANDMQEVTAEFNASLRRGGLTSVELVYSLAQGLNLDDVETAYVVLNAQY